MSESADAGTATKARARKLNGTTHAVVAVAPAPGPRVVLATVGTIQIGYPTDAALVCPVPFQTMGTAAATTVMSPTCRLYTPNGILVGTLDGNAPPPFTWSYTFADPLPKGVPLAVVVTGTTSAGDADENVQPFQAQGAIIINESRVGRA